MSAAPMPDQALSQAKRKARSARRHARLAAVQALYQIDLAGVDEDQVIGEFVTRDRQDPRFDETYFSTLVRGAVARREALDTIIGETLSQGWPIGRLSITMRAVLRSAAFELEACGEVPARVVISEYVDVARGFFDQAETGFANGVLDRLARRLRPDEWSGEES
jgi:N utilization substance protein B